MYFSLKEINKKYEITDVISLKLAMLIEGECQELGTKCAAKKYGYTKQRYFQIRAMK